MSEFIPNQFYVAGGTIPPEAPSYVERKADSELYERLCAGDFCYVLTSRQMGKSSLMARVAHRLERERQAAVAIVDLSQLGTERGEGAASRWYYGVASKIQRGLHLDCNLRGWWRRREALPPLLRLGEFFEDLVLAHTSCPVVIFIDEIDSTIPLPFASDFFAAIRACYNERALKPQFRRLTFALLGVARPSDLIPDLQRTPFNIGHRIDLQDFTFEEARALASALPGDADQRERLLSRVFSWTGGHPYLTQKILAEVTARGGARVGGSDVDETVSRVFIDAPINQADPHIGYVRSFLNKQGSLLEEIKGVFRLARLSNERVDDDPLSPVKSALKLSGLMKLGKDGRLVVRNRIYELTFADWEAGDALYSPEDSRTAHPRKSSMQSAVHHTTAKVVLLGDSGVGKTSLGWRLAHGEFKAQSSTHGQQFWVVNELGMTRSDGTQCEAVLWDLAGQPDYRLVHALFLDDVDLALVLFDPTDSRDPLHGVEFWLKQLKSGRKKSGEEPDHCPIILVGARADLGESQLTREELDEFCRQRGIGGGYLATSASYGTGLEELLRRMKEQIAWEQKPATVTTVTFKRIKDYVLGLKESPERKEVIVSPEELRARLQATDEAWEFTDGEMMTAVGHLANYGYVRVLQTSKGEERVLLSPELLNNLAASLVLEARRNPRGLGSLEAKWLLAGGYQFRELENLSRYEQETLLDSAALLFLEHNVCFRETDPLGGQSFLVFPELINLKKPDLEDEQPTEDGAAYTASGAVENVYASLVVLLGYTQAFTRTNQWRSHARYEVGDRLICGFRQEAERDGELDFVLYFGTNVGAPIRRLFQSLFESFLARRNLDVSRFEPVFCPNGHPLERAVIRAQLRKGSTHTFCSDCGERTALPKGDEPIQLKQDEQRKVDEQRWFAEQRTRFEQAVFRLSSYVESQRLHKPECFISYAWGDEERERWVERSLATDLQKAGIIVVLDRWENERAGRSVSRFVSRIAQSEWVIAVGTPLYHKKFRNKAPSTGSVVASEVDLISQRLMGTEEERERVIPVLLAGARKSSLPPLMWDRVHRDFRNERAYFITAFDLLLDLYQLAHNDPAISDLRDSLRESVLP